MSVTLSLLTNSIKIPSACPWDPKQKVLNIFEQFREIFSHSYFKSIGREGHHPLYSEFMVITKTLGLPIKFPMPSVY